MDRRHWEQEMLILVSIKPIENSKLRGLELYQANQRADQAQRENSIYLET